MGWGKYLKIIDYTLFGSTSPLPYFQSIKAGFPSPATDELKEDLSIEEYLIEKPYCTVFVEVKGDSMIDAHIWDGDTIIVEKGKKSHVGDIVIAIVDGEYTVKYLDKDQSWYFLRPGNPNYPNIYPGHEMEIFWVVTWLFRKYE